MQRFAHDPFHMHLPSIPKDLRPLFVGALFRFFSDEFVQILSPIFLFEFGRQHLIFSFLPQDPFLQGVTLVAANIIGLRMTILLLALPIAAMIRRLGYAWSLILGNLLTIAYYGTLIAVIQFDTRLLIPAIILNGISIMVYWPAYYTFFSEHIEVRHVGGEIGTLEFLYKLIHMLAPVISAFLAATFGFAIGFSAIIALLLLANIPLLFLPHKSSFDETSLSGFFIWVRSRSNLRLVIALIGNYLPGSLTDLWIVYVFLMVGSISRVGILFSLIMFATLLLSYLSGWVTDKVKGTWMFMVAGAGTILAWILRGYTRLPLHVIGVDALDRLSLSFFTTGFMAHTYLCARARKPFSLFVYRELVLSIISMTSWTLIVLFFCFSPSLGVSREMIWKIVFYIGAIASLFSLTMFFVHPAVKKGK